MNDRRLPHLHRYVAFEQIAEWELIIGQSVDPRQLDGPEFADGIFRDIDRS